MQLAIAQCQSFSIDTIRWPPVKIFHMSRIIDFQNEIRTNDRVGPKSNLGLRRVE
jgi:hypothetical protein